MRDPIMLANPRPVAVEARPGHSLELVGRSPAAARLRELVRRAAAGSGGVLVVAPAGTDAASISRDIHAQSGRAASPYFVVDCAGADAAALDRELFGLT